MDVHQILAAAQASGKYGDPVARPSEGGDFAPMHDFDAVPVLEATYVGKTVKDIKGDERTIHNFQTDSGPVDAWGCFALDNDLPGLEGRRVLVAYMGKVKTSSGRQAKSFTILPATA